MYHITSGNNLDSIMSNGLIPKCPTDMVDECGVYLFKTINDAENALLNWFGDRIDDWENEHQVPYNEVILEINVDGLILHESDAEYEMICKDIIPPNHITLFTCS